LAVAGCLSHQVSSRRGGTDEVATSVGWIGLAGDEAVAEEIVDDGDDVAGVDVEGVGELSLRAGGLVAQRAQDGKVSEAQAGQESGGHSVVCLSSKQREWVRRHVEERGRRNTWTRHPPYGTVPPMIGIDQRSIFVGVWEGREELLATAWTAAGTAHGRLSIAGGPGDGLLVDYTEQRDTTTMSGHGILFGDGWWWFDSYGFFPAVPGTASWRDGELLLERRGERGRTVTVLRGTGGILEQWIDTAVPADGPLMPLLRGTYTRRD
jgi:hypothetical protein